MNKGHLYGLTDSALDHRSFVFESRCGHIWRMFHIWLCFINFGGCSAHLAYLAHKSGHNQSSIYRWIKHHIHLGIMIFNPTTRRFTVRYATHFTTILIMVCVLIFYNKLLTFYVMFLKQFSPSDAFINDIKRLFFIGCVSL